MLVGTGQGEVSLGEGRIVQYALGCGKKAVNMTITVLQRLRYITFLHYCILVMLQHCGEKITLFYSYCSRLLETIICSYL